MRLYALAVCTLASSLIGAGAAADPALDALVKAYPDHLSGYDGSAVIWKDGTRMPISDGKSGKTFEQLLNDADIDDQFVIPYPLGAKGKVPGLNEDPGRIRYEPFFRKMYGDCTKGEVSKRLGRVSWIGNGAVMATTVNAVASRLDAVARELSALPASMSQFIAPSSGTYNCRVIAGTSRPSVHGYGAAIDLNAKFGDYWRWANANNGGLVWKNRIPPDIVDVFERHGFIWGGRWYHFDTFHFEYRPEIIALARQGWPRP